MKFIRLKSIVIAAASAACVAAGAASAANAQQTSAQQYLTGEISGNYPAGEYSVSGNVHVLPKATLSFAAGSVLRFDNYTGIVVRGRLICKGTPQQPVIFTSSSDFRGLKGMPEGLPEAFDWNGIKVTSEASGIALEYCAVAYSTFGLSIESGSTPVSIRETVFHHNGTVSLTREKKMFSIRENLPVSFTWPEPAAAEPVKIISAGVKASQAGPSLASPVPAGPSWKKTVGIAGTCIGIAGGALWLTGHLRAEHFNDLMMKPGTTLAAGYAYRDSRDSWVTFRNLGTGLLGLGAGGLVVNFAF